MDKDERIVVVTADIGYGILDAMREKYPSRVINVGSAETLMVGVAIGLSYSDMIPICYSITPFLIYRPFEMLRNYVDHEKVPIKLVGSGRDKDYAHDGFTHWSHDDLQVLGCFPNIKVYKPDDEDFTPTLVEEFVYTDGPCYLNLRRS